MKERLMYLGFRTFQDEREQRFPWSGSCGEGPDLNLITTGLGVDAEVCGQLKYLAARV